MDTDIQPLIDHFNFQPLMLEDGGNTQGEIDNPLPGYAESMGIEATDGVSPEEMEMLKAQLEADLAGLGYELLVCEGAYEDPTLYIEVAPVGAAPSAEEPAEAVI